MLITKEQKFSTISYSSQLHNNTEQQATMMPNIREQPTQYSGFHNLIDEIRRFLVDYGGKSEEERQHFSDVLNRAILGFQEDKNRLVAMINDELIKKRIHDIQPPHNQYKTLAEAIYAEIIGLNVLELILKNKVGLEEIQVVGTQIFEVRHGKSAPSLYEFASINDVERIQQNLLLFNHDTMNPRKKWSEAMMGDGSRVTLTGFGFTDVPTITIRFYTMTHFDLETLCHTEFGTINETIRTLLLSLIHSCFNLIVIGATNSGKTSLIKAMVGEMAKHERIVSIEGRRELLLKRDFPQRNIIEYEVDEEDELHCSKQAFKLALRQSPKRIIHAEIRDEDANIYVRACTRGHEGSMTSLHANELEDAPEAIADMCMLDQRGMNSERLTKRITQYVTQIGLHMAIVNGQRKLVRLAEYDYKGGVFLRDIVLYDRATKQWAFPQTLSTQAAQKILRQDKAMYDKLHSFGLVASC